MYIYGVTILISGEIIDSGRKLHTPLFFIFIFQLLIIAKARVTRIDVSK